MLWRTGFTALCLVLVFCLNVFAQEAEIRLECPEEVAEGEPFFATVYSPGPMVSATAHWLGKSTPLTPYHYRDGYAATGLLGISLRERTKGKAFGLRIEVEAVNVTGDGRKIFSRSIRRVNGKYPEERLTVSGRFTSPSAEQRARAKREGRAVARAKKVISEQRLWQCPLLRPVPGRITSVFGLRRYFNGQRRSPHSGVDFDTLEGEPVYACAKGRVILADDHFYSGKAVYLDHGQGVISMYFHLSKLLLDPGSQVEAGELIGLAGSTGRVTGPHLHFGFSVLGELVNPMPLMEGPCPEAP